MSIRHVQHGDQPDPIPKWAAPVRGQYHVGNVPILVGPAELVREFHQKFVLAIDQEPDSKLLDLRASLIVEEARECDLALFGGHLPDIAKELADLVYVTYGAAISLGIDLDVAVQRVHESNMSKLDHYGLPLKRPDGKVLKGPNYRPADVTDSLPDRARAELEEE